MRKKILLGVSVLILAALTATAAEDGLGTNVVRNLRVNDGGTIELGGTPITNWADLPTATASVSRVEYIGLSNAVQEATNALNSATSALNSEVIKLNANAITNPVGANVNFNGSYSPTNAAAFGFSNGVMLMVGQLGGTNGIYFYQPATGSNYWILTP